MPGRECCISGWELFCKKQGSSLQTQDILLAKVVGIFQQAEHVFSSEKDMSTLWIEDRIEEAMPNFTPSVFRAFLIEEHILQPLDCDARSLHNVLAKIELLPQKYRPLIEIYLHERIALRERQVKQQAKHPLAMGNMHNDFVLLARLARWLQEQLPDLTGWEMVQEEHVNTFLLTLTVKHRKVCRNTLYQFFRLGRKRKVMTHVPLTKLTLQPGPRTTEAILLSEQKALARLTHEALYTHPEEALLTALCFYHGLSPSQICQIRMEQVDGGQGKILMKQRPPVYLLAEDLLLLEQFLKKRATLPHAKRKNYLFITHTSRIEDKPLKRSSVSDRVHAFCGHTAQCLRITCFAATSACYGPQYLAEAFGLSLQQAASYASWHETFLEEEVKQQQALFSEKFHQR